MDRRQFLAMGIAATALAPVFSFIVSDGEDVENAMNPKTTDTFEVMKTDAEWKQQLTPEQHKVLRDHGTERSGSSPLNAEHRPGTFVCAGCGLPVFDAETKFESGTGWPSFYRPLDNAVGTRVDRTFFAIRTEVHCRRCGGHLGHVFEDGPPPTGLRYCMNGAAMTFEPAGDAGR